MNEQKSDTPDTPAEVIAAQAKSRALTPQTAELIGAKEYVDDAGHVTPTERQVTAASSPTKIARQRAEAYSGGEPIRGIPDAKVAELRGKHYPEAPQMDVAGELGDRTPAFVNWLWANKPADAKVRYAYRDIWPTALPAVWPPKAPTAVIADGTLRARRRRGPNRPKTSTPTITVSASQ